MTGQCMMCGKQEPGGGWHTVGYSDGDKEFFCSAACWNASADYLDDDDLDDDYDPGEDCGRWRNGRLGQQCTKAGSEECDWECPYSR